MHIADEKLAKTTCGSGPDITLIGEETTLHTKNWKEIDITTRVENADGASSVSCSPSRNRVGEVLTLEATVKSTAQGKCGEEDRAASPVSMAYTHLNKRFP